MPFPLQDYGKVVVYLYLKMENKENKMMVNVQFLADNAKDFSCVYLFLRMRSYAKDRGGRYTHFNFSKNERYNILPEIEKLGWINSDTSTIVSNRKICNRNEYTGIMTSMPLEVLESKNSLKGYILAVTETSIIRHRWLKMNGRLTEFDYRSMTNEKRLWDNGNGESHSLHGAALLRPKRSSFNNQSEYIGRVSADTLSEFMGITVRTITRWRKYAKEYDYCRYSTKLVNCQEYSDDRRDQLVCDRQKGGYSKKYKSYVYTDLVILTRLGLFTTKHYRGSGFYQYSRKSDTPNAV